MYEHKKISFCQWILLYTHTHTKTSSVNIETRTHPAKNLGPNHLGYRKIPPMEVTPTTQHSGMRAQVVEQLTIPMAKALPGRCDLGHRSVMLEQDALKYHHCLCRGGLNRAGLLLWGKWPRLCPFGSGPSFFTHFENPMRDVGAIRSN